MQSEKIEGAIEKARILLREMATPMTEDEMESIRGGQTIGCKDSGTSATITARRQSEGCDHE